MLLLGVGLVMWRLSVAHQPVVEGTIDASVALGLPDMRPINQDQVVPARSAVVWNTVKDSIVFEQNAFERLPIASITKLMTAIVALDMGVAWDKTTEIKPEEYVVGGQLLLHPGEMVTMRDLFTASLLGSANNATLAYVRELDIDKKDFVREMNRKAVEIGLEQTFFTDVTGLDRSNVSTAYEVARMAEFAFSHYPDIAHTTQQTEYSFVVNGSGREHTIRNTNKLVADGGLEVSGSKTGYLDEAGHCLVAQSLRNEEELVAVVLNSRSENDQYQGIMTLFSRTSE